MQPILPMPVGSLPPYAVYAPTLAPAIEYKPQEQTVDPHVLDEIARWYYRRFRTRICDSTGDSKQPALTVEKLAQWSLAQQEHYVRKLERHVPLAKLTVQQLARDFIKQASLELKDARALWMDIFRGIAAQWESIIKPRTPVAAVRYISKIIRTAVLISVQGNGYHQHQTSFTADHHIDDASSSSDDDGGRCDVSSSSSSESSGNESDDDKQHITPSQPLAPPFYVTTAQPSYAFAPVQQQYVAPVQQHPAYVAPVPPAIQTPNATTSVPVCFQQPQPAVALALTSASHGSGSSTDIVAQLARMRQQASKQWVPSATITGTKGTRRNSSTPKSMEVQVLFHNRPNPKQAVSQSNISILGY